MERLRGHDFGLFTYLYERLAKAYKTELYTQWESPFPTSDRFVIGQGLKDIKKLMSFEKDLKGVDLVTFFDFYKGELQEDLRSRGIPVFGGGRAEELEVDRWLFKKTLKKVGLPVIPADKVIGCTDLREYLEGLPKGAKRVIKSSCFRGDQETEPHEDMEETMHWLNKLAFDLGVQQDEIEFLCEHWIEADCEPGRDDVCSDGVFGSWGMVGWEKKGEALIGKMFERDDIPPILKDIDDAMAPEFEKRGYRGLYCMESRISKKEYKVYPIGTCFPLDICIRAGSPSSEGYCEIVDNFHEVVRMVAHGEEPIIEPAEKYLGILKFHTKWLTENFDVPIRYPKEIDRWVKIRNKHIHSNGKVYSISQDKGDNAGAVVAIGGSIDEVCDLCMERIEMIKCKKMEYNKTAFDDIRQSIEKGEEHGIDFS